jgi:hypothetical protein
MRSRLPVISVVLTAALVALSPGCGDETERGRSGTSPDTQLFLAGDGELWTVNVEAETAERRAVPELVGGDPVHRIVRRGDRLVLWGFTTYVLDPSRGARPEALARDSWFFIPSTDQERVWIAYLDPDSPSTVRALRAVQEVTVDGEVTVPKVEPPGGRWPLAAITDGLLLFESEDYRSFEAWDPRTGEVVRRLSAEEIGYPGPTHGRLLASSIEPHRSLLITDVLSGQRREIVAPDGYIFEYWESEFSPSGEMLAVPVRPRVSESEDLRPGETDSEAARELALVDLRAGEARLVPGSEVPYGYNLVTWDSTGSHVFITGGDSSEDRVIVAYRLGDERAKRLSVSVGDFVDMAAI